MDPDPTLIIRGASSMRRIDKLFNYIDPATHQIRVDVNTPLLQACDIDVQMQAGLRCADAFQVFNPEVVRLKAEATDAISQGALARMLKSEIKVLEKIDRTREKITALEEKIRALENDIATGAEQAPAPNDAAVQYEQVVYTTWVEKPELAVGPERQVPLEIANRLRDGRSQLAFWKLNVQFLKAKEEALVDFFKALCYAYSQFETSALHERTPIGSGYSVSHADESSPQVPMLADASSPQVPTLDIG